MKRQNGRHFKVEIIRLGSKLFVQLVSMSKSNFFSTRPDLSDVTHARPWRILKALKKCGRHSSVSVSFFGTCCWHVPALDGFGRRCSLRLSPVFSLSAKQIDGLRRRGLPLLALFRERRFPLTPRFASAAWPAARGHSSSSDNGSGTCL